MSCIFEYKNIILNELFPLRVIFGLSDFPEGWRTGQGNELHL